MSNSELMKDLEQMVGDVDRLDIQKKSEQVIKSLEIERNHEFMDKFFKVYIELCKAHKQRMIDKQQFDDGILKLDVAAEKMFGNKFTEIRDHYYPNESTPVPALSEYSRKGIGDQVYNGDVKRVSVLSNGHVVALVEQNADSYLEISRESIRFFKETAPKQAVIRTTGEMVYCNTDRTGIYEITSKKNGYRDRKRVVQGDISNFKVYPDGIVVSNDNEIRIYKYGSRIEYDLLQIKVNDFAMQLDGQIVNSEGSFLYLSRLKGDDDQLDRDILNLGGPNDVLKIALLPNGDLLISALENLEYKLIKLIQHSDNSYVRAEEYKAGNGIFNIQPLMDGRILVQTGYGLMILNPDLTVRETIEPALTTQDKVMRDFSIDSDGTIFIAQGREVLLYEGLNNE